MYKFLKRIAEQNILIDVIEGKLKLFSENDNIDSDLLNEIKANKEKLIQFLTDRRGSSFIELNSKKLETSPFSSDSSFPEKKKELLEIFTGKKVDYPKDKTLTDLFQEQAKSTPDNIALVVENREFTYCELDALSNQLARCLSSTTGIKSGDMVGILLDRSENFVISILAIMKLGAAYVPIDPNYPDERKQYIAEDTKLNLLITTTKYLLDLNFYEGIVFAIDVEFELSVHSSSSLNFFIDPANIAYIIYTSGSTGRPKGVVIEHISIVNTILSQKDMFGLSSRNKGLQFASFSFDASIWEIFIVLLSGAQLYVASEEERKDPKLIELLIIENKIDFATLPPYYFNLMNIENLKGLEILITAGEPPVYEKVKEFSKIGKYYNAYGPTETSICSCIFKMDIDYFSISKNVPIGKPIANTSVYILGSKQEILPYGVKGEIFIGGAGLARGYLNQEMLTEEKFIKNPFIKEERIYKTGDIGRYLPDGNIEFLGRKDSQIKIRGFRVELGEIESCLKKINSIREAVVLAIKDTSGENQLLAYFTAESQINESDLRGGLEKLLPGYMIPKHFVQLDQFFVTVNGKIDRKNLPIFSSSKLNIDSDLEELSNEIESKIISCCKEVLGLDKIGIRDDFFKLGGHSLDVIKVVNKLEVECNLKLEIQVFFEERILKRISKFAIKIEDSYDNSLDFIDDTIKGEATSNQKKFWFLDEKNNNDSSYNIPLILEWEGDMDFSLIHSAINETILNNKILRTKFKKIDNQILQIVDSKNDIDIAFLDWSTKTLDWDAIEDDFFYTVKQHFDLKCSSLFKFRIYKISKSKFAFALVVHHIIMDEWSIKLWLKEILSNYEVLKNNYPIICKPGYEQFSSIAYASYCNNINKDELNLNKAKSYWKNHLKGIEKNELPWFKNKAKVDSPESHIISWSINKLITNKLDLLAEENNTSVYSVVLTSYIILLKRLTDVDEITIGVPFSGRNISQVMHELGNFVSLMPFRTSVEDSDSFIEIIKKTRDYLSNAQQYQSYPIEQVLQELSLPNELYDSGFTWHGESGFRDTIPVLPRIKVRSIKKTLGKFPLWIYGVQNDDEIKLSIEYITDNFNKNHVDDFIECWTHLLNELIEKSKDKVVDLEFLTKRQLKEIDGFSEGPNLDLDENIITAFEEIAHNYAHNIAVNFVGEKYTYKRLNELSNELSHNLISNHKVKKGDHVLLLLDKSPYIYVALLAILKAGAVYVPIYTEAPLGHFENIKSEIDPKLIITVSNFTDISSRINLPTFFCDLELNSSEIFQNPIIDRSPLDTAYIMYTSGSTGKPKGVEVMHKSIVRLAKGSNYQIPNSSDINLVLADYSFDGSVQEIFTTLLNGAQLVCASKEKLIGLKELSIAVETYKVNNLPFITTQLFNQIVDYVPEMISKFKNMYVGGEDASIRHIRKSLEYRKNKNSIVHVYGPTEGTVFTSFYVIENVDKSVDIPIGKPVTGSSIYVLDTKMNKLPKGIVGEIYIGGEGLAKGYINNPEETEKKFLENPFEKKSLLYATGDYGEWDFNGNLIFRGRKDKQLKIRGYRIEIGEVMNALNKCRNISRAFVCVYENEGTKELIAYVAGDGAKDISKLREELKENINPFMIPTFFIAMEDFPLNKNGKVDVAALPIPDSKVDTLEMPTSDIELAILEIWKEILGINLIGINNDFFQLGGQSIKVISVLASIEEKLNLSLSIGEFFNSPTVKGIAQLLKNKSDAMLVEPINDSEYYPLSYAQRRLWVYQELNPKSIKYNIVGLYEVEGEVSPEIIEEALEKLILRHESLRTTFHVRNGKPCQKIHSKVPVFLEYIKSNEKTLEEILNQNDYNEEFQLDKSPLLRVRFFEAKDKKKILYFTIHHIICDEWSFNIIFKDFFMFLSTNNRQKVNDLKIRYRDYSNWHNAFIQSEVGVKQKMFWRSYLKGLEEPVHLKADKKLQGRQKVAKNDFIIEQKETKEFKNICINYEGTLFMGVVAVLNIVLHKYTNKKDILIGTPVTGRQQVELNEIIGFFVNMLPIRVQISTENSFTQIFEKTRESTILALENQQFPCDLIVDEILDENSELFKIGLTWHNVLNEDINDTIKVNGLTFTKLDYGFDQVLQDLWIFGREVEEGISFSVRYNDNKYSEGKIEELVCDIKKTINFIINSLNEPIANLTLSHMDKDLINHEISDIKFKF